MYRNFGWDWCAITKGIDVPGAVSNRFGLSKNILRYTQQIMRDPRTFLDEFVLEIMKVTTVDDIGKLSNKVDQNRSFTFRLAVSVCCKCQNGIQIC